MSERENVQFMSTMQTFKQQKGISTVEFAAVSGLYFMIFFALAQFASFLSDRLLLMNAALEGARTFAAMYNYTTPYTRTLAEVNKRLPGSMKIGQRTTMILSVRPPNGTSTQCTTDATCRAALGTDPTDPIDVKDSTQPVIGTTANVNLTMSTPIFTRFGLPNKISVNMFELVQGAKDPS
jgi:Flp pilus assembly protein TadG